MILDDGDELTSLDLAPVDGLAGPRSESTADSELNLRTALAEKERALIVEALRRSKGVRKDAARLLGIDQRNLPYYFRKHEIDPDAV
jgi:transcriptional regulator with GAF, ATPase, and Fis domain